MPDAPAPAALTRADRERMLLSLDKLVTKLVSGSGLPPTEWEDAEQEVKLLVWHLTENFDPGRGVKWSTYATAAAKRHLGKMFSAHRAKTDGRFEPDDWGQITDPRSQDRRGEDDESPDDADTVGQLHTAVQRQLAGGLLGALSPGSAEIVERIALGGMTSAQLATQAGHPVQVVKVNLKNAIRKLMQKGLTQHVATDAEVEAILVPNPVAAERCRESRRRARVRANGVGQEPSVPAQPTSPAEAAPCPALSI